MNLEASYRADQLLAMIFSHTLLGASLNSICKRLEYCVEYIISRNKSFLTKLNQNYILECVTYTFLHIIISSRDL